MKQSWLRRLLPKRSRDSWLRQVLSGSLFRLSEIRGSDALANIKTQIDTMRALARDSQISTALAYYATDATTPNTAGQIIWATGVEKGDKDVADIINTLFDKWHVNKYARDHILELATIGNLYLPTTQFYSEIRGNVRQGVVLDNNTIVDEEYEIVPSYKIPPEDIVHLWESGQPCGYVYRPSDDSSQVQQLNCPESSIIHFSLGGLMGDYTISARKSDGDTVDYDVQFAEPLLAAAVQPTTTLNLLEDAIVLSSLIRTIKFINVEAGTEETEIRDSLQMIKDAIEQQLSLNTAAGDAQSFVNPQSPNNLIYLPKINGQDAVSITDLNMAEASDADNKLLQYYQDKKLSVLGVPKEAMNFSSNEGLGGAGSVLSQRSALYANALLRLETAYMEGWKDALNKYFAARHLSGFSERYELHMNPIITTQSTIQFERRDSAINQATSLVDLLKNLNVSNGRDYASAVNEVLIDALPKTGTDSLGWQIDVKPEGGEANAF